MSFYHSETGVTEYIAMAEGYDGSELIAVLAKQLPRNASVLELGMGPGTDLDLLNDRFVTTGSDFSDEFLRRYLESHPEADVLELDAITIETDRRFDAIYSNKVLHHLDADSLRRSLTRQSEVVNSDGMVMHSFWHGSGCEEHAGLKFYYYDEPFLTGTFAENFSVVDVQRYSELEDDDSIYVLARVG